MLEVHGRDESGQGVLPPPEPAVVLVVAEPVHDVDQDHHRHEHVEHRPGEEARPRPGQIRATQPVDLRIIVCLFILVFFIT